MRKTLAKNDPVLWAQSNQRMQIRELVMAVISAIIKKQGLLQLVLQHHSVEQREA